MICLAEVGIVIKRPRDGEIVSVARIVVESFILGINEHLACPGWHGYNGLHDLALLLRLSVEPPPFLLSSEANRILCLPQLPESILVFLV